MIKLREREGPLTEALRQSGESFGLGRVPARLLPDARTRTVCGFCSTGCGLDVHLRDGAAINLSPNAGYPVNLGMACPKGWEALAPLASRDRATVPLERQGGRLRPVTWDAAIDTMVRRFRAIQERHGRESVAFLSTGQITTEEMAFLGTLAKLGMGMVHGDGNTRQCMATAVVAYKQSFGFDAPPYTYADLEESDVIVLVGSNLCIAHPILWERVSRNKHKPEIIVLDPRRTETAMAATQHHAIRPKSDLPLFGGLVRLFLERGWIDEEFVKAHTSGLEAMTAQAQAFSLERTCEATGLSAEDLERLAATIHRGKRVSFWWTMGINQSHEGVRAAQAIIDLALLTGNIGRPGTGANSITGQCNAMGSRLFSNTTALLGGRDFADAEHRREVAEVLGMSEQRIPHHAGMAYDQIVEGILAGKIRGLWVVGTNPAHSWINQHDLHDTLSRLDCLVVQDMYTTTETAQRADVLLPAAGWGEKDGTFINSERRIGLTKKVARAPGQALADFHVFQLVAARWGLGGAFREWSSPEAVFELLRRLSRGRPCDFTGVTGYDMLDAEGGVQWPLPEGVPLEARERRLFADGKFFHEDGRARFMLEASRPMPEPVNAAFPFVLMTGRGSSSQWHTQTRTAKSSVLRSLAPQQAYFELNPADARRLGIEPGQWVRVRSRRGELRARAFPTHCVRAGEVFLPMHYPDVNRLTLAVFDPHSRQPAYKACAVAILPDADSPAA